MKTYHHLTVFIFLFFLVFGFSQKNSVLIGESSKIPGTKFYCEPNCNSSDPAGKFGNAPLANGNGSIATSYTYSACGLDFTYHSAALHKRNFTFGVSPNNQPYTFNISGIPPCAIIEKAFVYANFERAGSLTSVNLSLTNPLSTNSVFPMTLIGTGQSVCWGGGTTGSKTFRADVTALISGNGNYVINGLPTGASGPDCNGFTMFVIWSNPTQNWTGHFVIADGSYPVLGGTASSTITGFNVCGPVSNTRNFMCIGDLQKIANTPLNFNSATANGNLAAATQSVWNYVEANVAAQTPGQTNAIFRVGPNSWDCFNLCVAGMYFRTTCSVCPVSMGGLTVNVASTPSCPTSNATVTSVSGGPGPYTYTWTPSAQNTSVATNLTSGIYTVSVTDATGCKTGAATINVVTAPLQTITVNSATICQGQSANLNASGAPSYSWSPSSGLSSTTGPNVVANPASTTVYSVSYTNSLGCTSTSTAQVVVNPTPALTVSGSTVCNGQTASLAVTSTPVANYTWTGPGSFNSTLQNPTLPNANAGMNGTYTLFAQTAAGCTNVSTAASVSVVPLPVPTASTSAVCQNQILNLNAGGGTSYQWSGPNGFSSIVQNPSIPNAQPNMSGTYTVIVTAASSCSAQTTVNATVYNLPSVNPSNNGPICSMVPLNLTVNSASSYTWNGPSGYSSNLQNPTINSPTVTNGGIYTVSITDNNGCINSNTTAVTVYSLPVPIVSGATACVGQNATITASGGASYQWSGPNAFSSSQQNPVFTNVNTGLSGIYTVILTSPDNCTASANVNLNIVPLPVPTASANAPICQNQNLQLTGGGGNSYQWIGPNGYSSTQQNPVIQNAQPLATGVYTLIVTAASSCSDVTTVSVTVNPLPNVTASNSGSVCELNQLTLSANGAQTYTWSGPGNFSSNLSSPVFTMALTSNSGTYMVIGTDANGCVNIATTVVDVQPNPVVIVSGATVCTGNTATLSCNSNGVSFQWSGPGGFSSNSPVVVIPNVNTTLTGVYTVVATGSNGCTSSNQAMLDTYPNPTIQASFSSPSVCLGGTIQASGQGGYLYSWQGANGNVISNEQVFTFTASSMAFNSTYTLSIIGEPYGCKNSTVIALTVYDLPKYNLIGNDKMCVPFSSTLSLNPAQNSAPVQNAFWTFNNLSVLSGTQVNYNMTTAGSIPVKVDVQDIRGCKNIQTFTLTGYPVPKADFYWSPNIPKEEVDDVTFKDASHGENLVKWTWFFQNNNYQLTKTGNPVSINYERAGNYAIMMIVENGWGCKDTIVKTIRVEEDVIYYVPDAFTPNGDGINDTFGPKGYGPFTFEISIFDRWGENLFTSTKLNEPWDGTYKGKECKSDVYVWKLNVTLPGGKKETKTGHVTLLR